ncbi:MAG: hypothetical protein AABM29_08090 [Actinomycetota bacterium]
MPLLFRSRIAQEFARNREFFAQINREAGEREQHMREFIRHSELVMSDLLSASADLREESRAQRQAVLRMIDKLDERLPPPNEPA